MKILCVVLLLNKITLRFTEKTLMFMEKKANKHIL